jgi:hypothetical protein
MKYVLGIVIGAVLGFVLGLGALYVNPMTGAGPAQPSDGWTFSYAYPDGGSLLLTHRGMRGLPLQPSGAPRLWERSIDDSVLNVLLLHGANGAPDAVATRLAKPSRRTDLLLNGAIVDDYWLVTVPGRGSFFVQSDDNFWPLLKDTLVPRLFGHLGRAAASYSPTVGPAPGGRAVVFGAGGGFAAMRGSAAESYASIGVNGRHGLQRVSGRLQVDFEASRQGSR